MGHNMNTRSHTLYGVLGLLIAVVLTIGVPSARAATANLAETWDGVGVRGWTDESVSGATLSNPSTYLQLAFPGQTIPMPSEDGAVAGVEASSGTFFGDYAALSISNISFSIKTDGHIPLNLRMVLHSSASGREWSFAGLQVSEQAGVWVVNNVPVDYAAGWALGYEGGTAEMFTEDLKTVDRIGVRLQQNGMAAQVYAIDGFVLRGINLCETIRGKVVYKGFQSGPVKVMAVSGPELWTSTALTELAKPGTYGLANLKTRSSYWIKAYIDSNTNGVLDSLEASGSFSADPTYLVAALDGMDIRLTEPTTPEGLPYWWVEKYFGTVGGGGSGEGESLAAGDSDGDGVANWKEYFAGTDPTKSVSVFQAKIDNTPGAGIVVKWNSGYANQTFSLMRATDLVAGFSVLAGGIAATPPENVYTDATATNAVPYFYKVVVEQ